MPWQRMAGIVLTCSFALYQESARGDNTERWTNFGLRPLGMGNAFVAVADDYNALYYNPAGMARLKSWDGEFLNPSLTFSTKLKGVYSNAADKLGNGEDIGNLLDFIEDNTGESFYVGMGLSPHLVFKGFGFGLSLESSAAVTLHRDISIDLDAGLRGILPIAFAMNFLDDRLSVGLALKGRVRTGVDRTFSIEDISAFENDETNSEGKELNDYVLSGFAAGTDLGILFTPTTIMEPTLGVSVTDFGGTSYKEMKAGENALGRPPTQLPSVNVGFSLKPIKKEMSYLLAAVDMHSINQPFSFSRKFNLGLEWGFGSIIKLQGGIYNGYATAGFQFDVMLLNVRFVTYAEELGAVAGTKEDRRYALQLKLLL